MDAIVLLQYLTLIILYVVDISKCQDCKSPNDMKSNDLSVIYSEHKGGLPSQLLMYAMLRQLRQEFYLNAYISKHCYDTLAQVFTKKSIQDVPVFEDAFCKSPTEFAHNTYHGPMEEILTNKDLHYGKFIWMFPANKKLEANEDPERPYDEYR